MYLYYNMSIFDNPQTRGYLQSLFRRTNWTAPATRFSPGFTIPGLDPTADIAYIRRWRLESFFPTEDISHQFITVALPNDYDLNNLKKIIENGLQYQYLDTALARVESFSDGGKRNFHIHILKKGNYQRRKIVRDLSRKFKIEENFIDVISGKSSEKYHNRLAYIHGDKKDESKKADVELDIKWRIDNGFAEIYNLSV